MLIVGVQDGFEMESGAGPGVVYGVYGPPIQVAHYHLFWLAAKGLTT